MRTKRAEVFLAGFYYRKIHFHCDAPDTRLKEPRYEWMPWIYALSRRPSRLQIPIKCTEKRTRNESVCQDVTLPRIPTDFARMLLIKSKKKNEQNYQLKNLQEASYVANLSDQSIISRKMWSGKENLGYALRCSALSIWKIIRKHVVQNRTYSILCI